MKIEEESFVEEAVAEEYAVKKFDASLADLQNDGEQTLAPLANFVEAALNSDKIASAELWIGDADLLIKLQTSIINLPLHYGKNIHKIMVGDGEVDVNVYMLMDAEKLNKTGSRIDELASSDDFVADVSGNVAKFNDWVKTQLQTIAENEQAAAEADDEEK